MDYRHNPTDVIAGGIIGVLVSWYGYRQYYPVSVQCADHRFGRSKSHSLSPLTLSSLPFSLPLCMRGYHGIVLPHYTADIQPIGTPQSYKPYSPRIPKDTELIPTHNDSSLSTDHQHENTAPYNPNLNGHSHANSAAYPMSNTTNQAYGSDPYAAAPGSAVASANYTGHAYPPGREGVGSVNGFHGDKIPVVMAEYSSEEAETIPRDRA